MFVLTRSHKGRRNADILMRANNVQPPNQPLPHLPPPPLSQLLFAPNESEQGAKRRLSRQLLLPRTHFREGVEGGVLGEVQPELTPHRKGNETLAHRPVKMTSQLAVQLIEPTRKQ